MAGETMPAHKGKGKSGRTAPSFADRITYFPMNVEEIPNNIEREYLLGGTGRKPGTSKLDLSTIDRDDEPLPPSASSRVMLASNVLMLLLGVSLSFICWFESRDIENADENCPLLYIGIAIGGVVTLVALLGFLAMLDLCAERAKYTVLYVYHTGTILSMVLLTMLAISTLVHWDIGGEPAHTVFHKKELVGVKHRYLIWGLALAASLGVVGAIFGTLGSEWAQRGNIFQWTTYAATAIAMIVGALLILVFGIVYQSSEVHQLAHPVWLIGSAVAGICMVLAGLYCLTSIHEKEHFDPKEMHDKLSKFLVFMIIAASAVMVFSVGNAVTAETDDLSNRRTNVLLSGLIGIWGQLNTCVVITAASRWRHKYWSVLQKSDGKPTPLDV